MTLQCIAYLAKASAVTMLLSRSHLMLTFMLTFMLLMISTGCHGIVMEEDIELPPEVHKSGSLDTLTLDCPFEVEVDDIPEHLTVKWEYKGFQAYIYLWIHDTKPQSLGPFKNRVDLEYQISEDPIYKHRALSLLNPTTELTGIYTCRVASFFDEKVLTRRVIIFSEPSEFKVKSEQIDGKNVKIICAADNIFPEPDVYLYKNYDGQLLEIEGIKEEKTWKSTNGNEGEGSYSIHAEFTIADEDLSGPTEFGCDLRIPETNLTFTNTVSYEPRDTIESSEEDEPELISARHESTGDSPQESASTSGSSNSRCHLAVLLIFVSSLLLVLNL